MGDENAILGPKLSVLRGPVIDLLIKIEIRATSMLIYPNFRWQWQSANLHGHKIS